MESSVKAVALDRIALVDCEASSLRQVSYPIEVGWCLAKTGEVESYLIAPLNDWDDWDAEAESVHGISRQLLLREGRPAAAVSTRMFEALQGLDVYADGSWDQRWVWRLFQAVDLPAPVLKPFDRLLDSIVRPEVDIPADEIARDLARATEQGRIIDESYAHAERVAPKRHRAGSDAYYLYLVLQHAMVLTSPSPD
jgi:hypothetical protein